MSDLEQILRDIDGLRRENDNLRSVIARLNLATPMTDYATTSTIVGWSAFANKELSYGLSGLNGKFCRVHVYINGTSNATSVTFTLPFAASNIAASWAGPIRVQDNGGAFGFGLYSILAGGTTVTAYSTPGGAGWTGSGNKAIEADFWYELL